MEEIDADLRDMLKEILDELHKESRNRDLEKEYITWINYFKRNHIYKIEQLVSPANSPSLLSNFPLDIAEKLEERLALAKKNLMGFSPGFTRRANANYHEFSKEICVDSAFAGRNHGNNSGSRPMSSSSSDFKNFALPMPTRHSSNSVPLQPQQSTTPPVINQPPLTQHSSISDAGYDVIIPTQLLGETSFYQLGEMLGERHMIVGCRGEGFFSQVLKCKDIQTNEFVALKLYRKENLNRAEKEIQIIQKLRGMGSIDRNLITMFGSFQHGNHVCLIFELMDMNLQEYLEAKRKKYGNMVTITEVIDYSFQIICALSHLETSNIIHADIKPDNMLITIKDDNQLVIKIADFGSAMEVQEAEWSPALCHRYYRAPEIVLEMKYDQSIDVFSLGCSLYEIATGIPLFCSKDPHHHLKLLTELRGKFPENFLSRSPEKQKKVYYDDANTLLEKIEVAPGEFVFQPATLSPKHRDVQYEILKTNPHTTEVEKGHIVELVQLIMDCTEIDPERRIRASSCLANKLFR